MSLFRGESPSLGSLTVTQSDPKSSTLIVTAAARDDAQRFVDFGTVNATRAGGGDGLRLIRTQKDNAGTGDMIAANFRANNSVASSTGKLVGVKAYAANNNDSSSLTVHAAEVWALTKGNDAATVRAMEVGLDFDGGETVTDAIGIRVVSQAAGTITNHWLLQLVDDSASSPGARVVDAFVRVEATATTEPKYIIDASGVAKWAAGLTDQKDIVLLKFKDDAGNTKYFGYDDSGGNFAVIS